MVSAETAFAFAAPLPLAVPPRTTAELNRRTLLCVSRPEPPSNPINTAIGFITTLFRRPPERPENSPAPNDLRYTKDPDADVEEDESKLRLHERIDDDSIQSRPTSRGARPRALPSNSNSRRRRSAIPFFPRRRPKYPDAFSRISDARLMYFVDEAHSRRRKDTSENPRPASFITYDLQRALFDDLTGNHVDALSPEQKVYDAPFPAKPNETIKDQSSQTPQRDPSSLWGNFSRLAVDTYRFVTFQSRTEASADSNSKSNRKNGSAAAFTVAAVATDMAAALEADSDGDSAAAAFAAAAVIATSSATNLDPAEQEGLKAAVAAARAVTNADDATVFVDTVGVSALITASRVLPGTERAAALTALANIAIVLPKMRSVMLSTDKSVLVETIRDIVYRNGRFNVAQSVAGSGGLWFTEALVSCTHLLGSLALAKGAVGSEFRSQLANDEELVRKLQRIAGGMKNGEAEGAARAARRALGALGVNQWKPRVPGQKGLRILSIDGGGTRAIFAFEMLKQLKKMTGCEIHELFDVICGTSTGAIVAASIGLGHKSVEEVELLYRDMIGKVFARHPVNGPKMLLTRAYYDTKVLETTLQRECGHGVFIDSLADENMNKVFVVSSVMSRDPKELFVFRNYTYPLGHESRYDGTAEAQLWEALRASSAAPTFFTEIRVNGELHADGAIVANNPTAVAVHESKCMYPGVPIELLLSLGNGMYQRDSLTPPPEVDVKKNMGWGDVFGSIVASATSTETVHNALQDLMSDDIYFRFNPKTVSMQIDETSAEALSMFVREAQEFIEANIDMFERVARMLRPNRNPSIWGRLLEALQE